MLTDLNRQQQLIILGLCFLFVIGLGVMIYRHTFAASSAEISVEISDTAVHKIGQAVTEAKLFVHLTGGVKREGVYKVKLGDRIVDVISLAGGATPLADLSSINLAEKVKDGQKIVIPIKKILVKQRNNGSAVEQRMPFSSSLGKISINSADVKALCKIKGIGQSMAKRIVEYRTKNGPFYKVEDLTKVKGIGSGKLKKIKNEVAL